MADQAQPPATTLVIPPDVQEKFGALIELVKGSESMNNEERQYWINILPIMTPEQIKNLEDILASEKKQLAAIDAKYSKEGVKPNDPTAIADIEKKMKNRKQEREQVEQSDAQKEADKEAEILAQIQSF